MFDFHGFWFHTSVVLHRRQHFAHGSFEADKHRARNNGVTDIQLGQVRDAMDQCDVAIIDSVAGVDLKLQTRRIVRAIDQALELGRFNSFGKRVRELARVQFHHLGAEFDGDIDLFAQRIDEHAHANAASVESLHRRHQLGLVRDEIESALGRDFLALFRNETDFIRHDTQREVDDLGGVSHLEIEFRHERFAQTFDVAILNVTPVRTQMRGDPVRTGALADARDRDRIRLAVFRFRHRGVTRLPQCGDVIDVYAESKCSHGFLESNQL